jgi:alpha-galactosidase
MTIYTTPNSWILETATTAYALGVNPAGRLVHTYWGARLRTPSDYPALPNLNNWASFNGSGQLTPEEYPAYAGATYNEPCIKVNLPDGVRDLVLDFKRAEVRDGDQSLIVHLADHFYPVTLELHYRVHAVYDLIERYAVLTNNTPHPITIERIFSAQWHLPAGDGYRLTHVHGKWAEETQIVREMLDHGTKILESRRLTTSHHANPWFMVDRGGADEQQGEVWYGALQWSGNWKIAAEVTDFYSTRVNIGLNDWDFAWRLNPGEAFTTPAAFGGYTPDGFGAASRHLHDYIRENILPHGQALHKVLYNSWEATIFDVDEKSQGEIAEIAASLGVELFVMDDGWFHGRKDDHAGLGDWWPDADKFPNSLNPLIEKVNALGMEFGLWVEPEMVNPNSELYRQHPDWAIHFPNRARTEMRNQLILNFGREDVQDYIIDLLDKLLADHNIAFIKWDMNRNISEPGWDTAPGDPREIWVRYVQGLYRVWGTLCERHPKVIFQSCSGGGGRADMGILRFADQIWTSDNTDAPSRLTIQEGFSYTYPPNTMEAWVTDAGHGKIPLEFRLHVSMCGSLGIGGNLHHWTDDERALAAKCVARYKEIRPVIQQGDLYRLISPRADEPGDVGNAARGAFSAVQYVSKDKREGVLFAFRTFIPQFMPQYDESIFLPTVYLRGLDADAMYEVEGYSGIRSGAAWMHSGLRLTLPNFGSSVRRIWQRS